MHYILYEHDHENRATALANHMPIYQLVKADVKKVPGLTTLIFWGHGTPGSLCGLTPYEAAETVKAWKAANDKLATVEILTCNSRHAGSSSSDPFVQQFRKRLGFRLRRKLTVKSMPIRMGQDGLQGDSILFADYKSKTWCYVTAPSESALLFMRKLFKEVCEQEHADNVIKTAVYFTSPPPRAGIKAAAKNPFAKFVNSIGEMHTSPKIQGFAYNERFMQDLLNALKDDAFRREFISTRKYSMNYGDFDHLRDQLVTIK